MNRNNCHKNQSFSDAQMHISKSPMAKPRIRPTLKVITVCTRELNTAMHKVSEFFILFLKFIDFRPNFRSEVNCACICKTELLVLFSSCFCRWPRGL